MMISKEFDKVLDEIQAILLSFLVKLGPFFVALMPALFSAYAIYHTFKADAGNNLAMLFAVIVGLALETVGIVATHTAVELYNGKQSGAIQASKFWLMSGLVPVYVLGVAASVWFSEGAFTPLVKSLGIASPFLTCIVYIAVALARDLASIQQGQKAQERREDANVRDEQTHKRALELKQFEAEQTRQLRELELRAQVQAEQVKAEAQVKIERARSEAERARSEAERARLAAELAQAEREQAQAERDAAALLAEQQHTPALVPAEPALTLICEDCQRDGFKTVQALNAHQRFCTGKAVPVANGNGHKGA